MSGSSRVVIAFTGVALAAPTTAAADHTQLGVWFGPRVFAGDCSNDDVAARGCRDLSLLGYIEDAPAHPKLENTISFGIRIARPFLPWLVPELELAVAPTKTNAVGGAAAASVVWLDPRLHLRIELMPGKRLQPFIVIGGGSPVTISSARQTFATGITGDGYIGGGVRFDTTKGFAMRFDARVALIPGADRFLEPEVDIGFGLELQLGVKRKRASVENPALADRDSDGIPDDKDNCGDRPEDKDGFEDADGCPDIDNDLDRVLDVADKCDTVPETYNGFADDDGCPDTVPGELDVLRGTVEGLIYAEAETQVRASAQPSIQKIAKLMLAFPSIKILAIGHTDDREAKQFIEKPAPGQPAPDLAALSVDLSKARAQVVKQALVDAGIAASRIEIDGKGSEEPVVENDKPRNRSANRRVEVKLWVPPSAR